jgi:hypothetical protein
MKAWRPVGINFPAARPMQLACLGPDHLWLFKRKRIFPSACLRGARKRNWPLRPRRPRGVRIPAELRALKGEAPHNQARLFPVVTSGGGMRRCTSEENRTDP